jgi:hypothetical protein
MKYVLGVFVAAVIGVAGFFLWRTYFEEVSICADEVRGFQDAVGASIAATTQDLQEVRVALDGSSGREYTDDLEQLSAAEFLAVKACDTQCKLLERCLSESSGGSVASLCPQEYADYRKRVEDSLKLMQDLQEVASATKSAAVQAKSVVETKQLLLEAQNGAGASGGREAVLRQQLAAQMQSLTGQVDTAARLARTVNLNRVQ